MERNPRPIFVFICSMSNLEETAALCALNRIFGFDPKTGNALIRHAGNASAIFQAGENEIEKLTGPYSRYRTEICRAAFDNAAEELVKLEGLGIGFVGITQDSYPPLLKECPDAPIGLYIRSGSTAGELFSPRRRIAVVGTRDISQYGKEWCRRIIDGLASSPEKPVIVSGLALGTDIIAHTAALEAGLPTIGVMATGPETVYPFRHRSTAEQMASLPDCGLITDYPPGTAPLAVHFLRRNRIIAGLSEATILVESKTKGGGMMTSRLAFSYSREVYALPGRADDIRSQGCNMLIREKIAEPLTDIDSMLAGLGFGARKGRRGGGIEAAVCHLYGNLAPERRAAVMDILRLIRKDRGITIDELAAATAMSTGITVSICTMLESDGIITVDILQRCAINPRKSELFF